MFIVAFRSLSKQLITISVIIALCALLALVVDGRDAAIELLATTVTRMNGLTVWTFGYGLAAFIAQRGRLLPIDLNGVLIANDATASATVRIERSTYFRNANRYTVPITALGVLLTAFYGIPGRGVTHVLVFVGICSIYYVGGFLLFHFIEVTLAFNELFESMDAVEFKRLYNPLHLENLTNYLALTTALGLVGIYSGFRGTITADFQFPVDVAL